MPKNDHSNPPSIDAAASEKQTNSTAGVKPHDVAPASVDAESISNKKELSSLNETRQVTVKAAGPKAEMISKKMRNQNALRHGLYSKHVLMKWESEDDFNCLVQDFRDEWKPTGRSEEQAVFDLAYLTLLKWRAIASAQLDFFKATVSDELKSGECSWDDIIEHQKRVPAHARSALRAATTLIDDLRDAHEKIRRHPYWTETTNGKEVQNQVVRLGHDVSMLIERTKKEVIEGIQDLVKTVEESASRFDDAYQADKIEKQLDLVGKFDAKIEKVIRRLVQIKVFKRVDVADAAAPPHLELLPILPADSFTEQLSAEAPEAEQTDSAKVESIADPGPESEKAGKPKAG